MKLSRREGLKKYFYYTIGLIVFLLFPLRLKRARTAGAVTENHDMKKRKAVSAKTKYCTVSIAPCGSYDHDEVYNALKNCLGSLGFSFKKGMSVLLKPNIIAQNTPDQATTTHPAILEALCRLLIEKGCSISIGDSMAFYQGGGSAEALKTSGMCGVARRYGARLVPFETTMLRKMSGGHALDTFYVTEEVFKHDLVINLPKLKVHRLARYTGAIKNMYGCVVGGTKQLYHTWFNDRPDYKEFWGKPLVDVYEAIQPGLTIMDAVVGLDRDGPAANGEPRFTGLVLASESGPALDLAVCRIIGFDPLWVPAVREAVERGLVSAEKLNIIGEAPLVPYVKLPDDPPKKGLAQKLDRYVFKQFMVEPRIDTDQCTRCNECVSTCAPGAISYGTDGYPHIDYGRCIYCYCCESYCREGAVYLHGSVLNLLIRAVRRIIKL